MGMPTNFHEPLKIVSFEVIINMEWCYLSYLSKKVTSSARTAGRYIVEYTNILRNAVKNNRKETGTLLKKYYWRLSGRILRWRVNNRSVIFGEKGTGRMLEIVEEMWKFDILPKLIRFVIATMRQCSRKATKPFKNMLQQKFRIKARRRVGPSINQQRAEVYSSVCYFINHPR